ncbi:MAG: Hsp70 family protein [Deltaproteobacteria bacterium]|nr:Hsp70 family protein [Deltaproteobacteria bacterium]
MPKGKDTPFGRVTVEKDRFVVQTQFATPPAFVEGYRTAVDDKGILLPDTGEVAPGAQLVLDMRIAGGQSVFLATGEVRSPPDLPPQTIYLQFKSMDAASQQLHKQILLARAQAAKPKARPAPAAASGAPAAAGGTAEKASSVGRMKPGAAGARSTGDSATSHHAVMSERAQRALSDRRYLGALAESIKRMVLVEESGGATPAGPLPSQVEGPIVGIDLGTTNSCCAMVKEGSQNPFVIPSRRGHNTIPSVVALDPMGEVLVGSAAKAQMEINPARTIYGSKRLVGRPFDSPVVSQVRDRFHYEIVAGASGEAAVRIDKRLLSLEEVASYILMDIRNTAQEYLGKLVERAVITVPAYYNENQRSAVRKAGELAGLWVERIVNEPTAAALSYGYKRKADSQRLLVYDLGGGTFDASVLDLHGEVYEVLSTGGDTFLGGVDFDTQLMDHVLIEFQLDLGRLPEMERVAFLRVLQAAEFAKRTLSSKNEVEIRLPFIGRVDGSPVNLEVKVTRQTMEELVRPLVQRTLDVCDAVLAERSMKPADIDDILLVGGQTRMPLVRQMIQEHFGKEPLKGVHPDESVATGAALLAKSVDEPGNLKLVDVLPISIGVGVPGGTLRRLISAGTTLPASRTYGFYTYFNGQTEMYLPVYQGDSTQVDQNESLGVVELEGIPPGPAGSKMIEITLSLNAEGLLAVAAKERGGAQLADVSLRTYARIPGAAAAASQAAAQPAPQAAPRPAAQPAAQAAAPSAFSAAPAAAGDDTLPRQTATLPQTVRRRRQPAAPGPRAARRQESPRRGLWAFLKRLFGRR